MAITLDSEQAAMVPLLAPANINPESFLATDYLNHFNEIVMLLEMVPDMPELLEDAFDWEPKSYTRHFEDSGFDAADLAIEAYHIAPGPIRSNFDTLTVKLDQLLVSTLNGLKQVDVINRGFSDAARELVRSRVQLVQEILMDLNGVIHGRLPETQPETDVTPTPITEHEAEDANTQEDIDALFD